MGNLIRSKLDELSYSMWYLLCDKHKDKMVGIGFIKDTDESGICDFIKCDNPGKWEFYMKRPNE